MTQLTAKLKSFLKFDGNKAKRAWTHCGPDAWQVMSNADICSYGARYESTRRAPIDAALVECVEVLERVGAECPVDGESSFGCPFCNMGGPEKIRAHETEHHEKCPSRMVLFCLAKLRDTLREKVNEKTNNPKED